MTPLTPRDITELNAANIEWGSCYTLKADGTYSCNLSSFFNTISQCSGLYNNMKACGVASPRPLTQDSNGFWSSTSMTESEFDTSIASITSIGDNLWGGIYVGKYQPSIFTVSDELNTIVSTDTSRYAIIVDPSPSLYTTYQTAESVSKNTSIYDGDYNKKNINTKLHSLLKIQRPHSIFPDWYIPSIAELVFLHQQLGSSLLLLNKLSQMINARTTSVLPSSSFFTMITGNTLQKSSLLNIKPYIYTLNMNYGTFNFMNPYTKSKMAFFRRVQLTS